VHNIQNNLNLPANNQKNQTARTKVQQKRGKKELK